MGKLDIEVELDNIIRKNTQSIKEDLADLLLLVELKTLYYQKVYGDEIATIQSRFDLLSSRLDDVLNEHYAAIKKDLESILESILELELTPTA